MKIKVLNTREVKMKVEDIKQGTVFYDSNENLYFKTSEMELADGRMVSSVYVVVEDTGRDKVNPGDPAFLSPDMQVTALVD